MGRGAVAVLLVEGPNAVHLVDEHFKAHSGRRIADAWLGRIAVGHWGGPVGEELVVCRTGDHRVEIHCHGGVAAIRAIIDSLVAEGCQEVPWREWRRTSSADAIQAEAHIALAEATTVRTAAILLDQLNGALANAVRAAVVAVEAGDWSAATEFISALLSNKELGLRLTTPWRVVLCGPPNVGKSSLINALAGYERAIVSPIPGTTRDVVTLHTAIEGWPVELADTAGLRTSADELEAAGVRLAQTVLAAADLIVFVNDVTQPNAKADSALIAAVQTTRMIEVWNKVDISPDHRAGIFSDRDLPESTGPVYTSAETGKGIAELTSAIAIALVPYPPAPGAAVPFLPRHIESLLVAHNAIERRDGLVALDSLHSLLAIGGQSQRLNTTGG
jgi:tRNA modification GTPase